MERKPPLKDSRKFHFQNYKVWVNLIRQYRERSRLRYGVQRCFLTGTCVRDLVLSLLALQLCLSNTINLYKRKTWQCKLKRRNSCSPLNDHNEQWSKPALISKLSGARAVGGSCKACRQHCPTQARKINPTDLENHKENSVHIDMII